MSTQLQISVGESPTPTKRGRQAVWPDIIAQVRAAGGEWVKVSGNKHSSMVSAGQSVRKEHPDIETTTRKNDDGTGTLYMRLKPVATAAATAEQPMITTVEG